MWEGKGKNAISYRRRQENRISASVSIWRRKEGRTEDRWRVWRRYRAGESESEPGVRKGTLVDRSLEKAPHSPAGSCSALVLLVQCWWTSCPPNIYQEPTPPLTCPPTALHVLELCWQPGPQTSTMEARPWGLCSHVLHSWESDGMDGGASPQQALPLRRPSGLRIRGDKLKKCTKWKFEARLPHANWNVFRNLLLNLSY